METINPYHWSEQRPKTCSSAEKTAKHLKRRAIANVIKLRNDEPSGYYCLDGIFYLKARRKL